MKATVEDMEPGEAFTLRPYDNTPTPVYTKLAQTYVTAGVGAVNCMKARCGSLLFINGYTPVCTLFGRCTKAQEAGES